VWELALIEMLVQNNTSEAMKMTLNITCQDVAGTSCLGTSNSNTTVLWAGELQKVFYARELWMEWKWRWVQWERWYITLLFAS
jgi:ABC-type hemin transport system ATPase subunit